MDKLEKEVENMKNPTETFQTQFDPRLPTMLKRTTCGIASLYSGLKYLGHEVGEFPDFAMKYINSNKFNVPTYTANLTHDQKDFKVPILYNPQDTPETLDLASNIATKFNNGGITKIERTHTPDEEMNLAFTISNGFDHRGVNPFLKQLNLPLSAKLVETNELPQSLTEQDNSVILASVEHKYLGYPAHAQIPTEHITTHIITIYNISKIGNTTVATFSDPAFLDPRDAIQVRSVDFLKNCLIKSTVISGLPNNTSTGSQAFSENQELGTV